jgi:predicted CXXCH cytochrome family protein
MRKQMIFILTILLLAGVGTMAIAEIPEIFGSGIEESCHNFSHLSWLPTTKICHVCHTVHKEALPRKQYPNGLLWKRDVDSVSYNLYNSFWGAASLDTRDRTSWTSLTGKKSNLPDGISKLCLACHDGIIAPDVFILHHFVSAKYDVTKTNLRDPDTTLMGISGSITEVLDGGEIQCSSCHDVHGVESIARTKLLRAEKTKLCLTCHRVNVER